MARMTPVKRARIKRGLLAKDVAEALEITAQYLSEIENGRTPSFALGRRLATFYGEPMDRLFPAFDVNGELNSGSDEQAAAAGQ